MRRGTRTVLDAAPLLEILEQRIMLDGDPINAEILPAQQALLADGLAQLATWCQAQDANDWLEQQLPLIGDTAGHLWDLGGTLDDGLHQPVRSLFSVNPQTKTMPKPAKIKPNWVKTPPKRTFTLTSSGTGLGGPARLRKLLSIMSFI